MIFFCIRKNLHQWCRIGISHKEQAAIVYQTLCVLPISKCPFFLCINSFLLLVLKAFHHDLLLAEQI